MINIHLQHVAFEPDGGMQIGYYLPDKDVKADGLVQLRTLMVPSGFDYDDELDAVASAVKELIVDVLDDWDRLPSATEPQ